MAQTCPACGAANDDDLSTCFTCGSSLAPERAPIRLGARIADRYEILERLGKGGMGAVYRARDHVLEEDVALKVLREDLGQEAELARRFRTEIKLARKVVHRNVCRIYEYGEADRRLFISMELIQGTDLKHILKQRGALPHAEAYAISIQVARGLQAIHDIGVIHRDLKAPNIMIDAQGIVRLMDFGIAKDILSQNAVTAGATATGHIIGTPDYMSPEQASAAKLDFRSDVYSLGVLVFELFTGELPFRAETPVATLLKHLSAPPPLDGPGAARIPDPLKTVLARALAKDPAARYQTAREFADALRQAEAMGPTQGSSATAPSIAPVVGNTAVVPQFSMTDSMPTPIPAPTLQQQPSPAAPTIAATVLQAVPAPRPAARSAPSPQPSARATTRRPAVVAVASGAVVALAVAVALGSWLVTSGRLPGQPAPASATPASTLPTAAAPAAVFPVRINALPWARVRVNALGPGIRVPQLNDADRTTPFMIELPEGEYSLELENDGLTKPLTQNITIRSGQTADFLFTMPAFDPDMGMEKSGWRR